MAHWYIPGAGQTDAAERATALGLPLGTTAQAAGYGNPAVPCAVCDHNGAVVITPEPTTFAEVWAAHDALVAGVGAPPISLELNEAGNQISVVVKFSDGSTRTGVVPLI